MLLITVELQENTLTALKECAQSQVGVKHKNTYLYLNIILTGMIVE